MKKKTLDAVEMKNAIQERHAKEYAGMTDEERRARVQKKLAESSDPVVRKLRSLKTHNRLARFGVRQPCDSKDTSK